MTDAGQSEGPVESAAAGVGRGPFWSGGFVIGRVSGRSSRSGTV